MDKFLEWLKKNDKKHQALCDSSYKNAYTRQNHINSNQVKVNTELATYGDAVLKLALCQILWNKGVVNLTEEKKRYESDRVLVEVIAKKYKILNYLAFDEEDNKMPKDYYYKNDGYKYIATAIEACLGAMYMDSAVSWNDIIEIVTEWKRIIDDRMPNA